MEELFVRMARILRLTVQGIEIQTTAEHPFFVLGHGWLPANELHAGDFLATHDGGWVRVDAVDATETWGTVYNLRVHEDHTYFVGRDEWRFSVWAHNANYYDLQSNGKVDKIARRLADLQASGEPRPRPHIEEEFGRISGRAKSIIRGDAETYGYQPAIVRRGPKTPADGLDALQLRANAAINELLQTEFPGLRIDGGGRMRGTLEPIRPETHIPGSGPGVRSPDFTMFGELTPDVSARLSGRLRAAVQSELGSGPHVGSVRAYGLPTQGAVDFAINVGPVRASGSPTKRELSQILSYRASGIPIIHVSYGRGS